MQPTSTRLPLAYVDPDSISQAMTDALRQSKLSSNEITAICPHAMCAPKSDIPEMVGIEQVIGHSTEGSIAVVNHKSCFGHTEYASGLLSLITAILVSQSN